MAKALIATVGGTPQPLIKSITEHQPEFVCFLCSQESVDLVAAIKQGVKDQLQPQTIAFQDFKVISNDVGDLIKCYEDALKCVNKLKSLGYKTDDIVVDYTGGTKTMS
ncbi:MAG TPA: TIGR02710 family CRISPR-associated protein, partial [Acidobacteriota bacterium]|nr:TIGR02710 family CRISPR-associated protein [Acidobacteriota bacterium]